MEHGAFGMLRCGAEVRGPRLEQPALIGTHIRGRVVLFRRNRMVFWERNTVDSEIMVPRIRFERTTFPLGGGRSILLSYRGMLCGYTQAADLNTGLG